MDRNEENKVIGLNDQILEELNKAIDDMTLFDDDLMSKVFDGNTEATELLLSIILERDDIKVLRVKGQVDMRSPYVGGRSIRLDIHAVLGGGTEFDVEVQRNEEGSNIRRARFNGSMMDTRMLRKKQEFKELRDAYVIFICQHDKFGKGDPVYHVDKVVRETGKPYDDGAYTIYVNGVYQGENSFGRLAHDFNCKEADDFYYKPFANGVRHFKETKEGREIMCESFERLADKVAEERAEQRAEQTTVNNIRLMMKNMKCTLEDALNILEITGKDRAVMAKMLQKSI